MTIAFERRGSGRPLLLVHGLGSTRNAWKPILHALEPHREIILIDLPGHGATPPEPDSGTFAGLVRSLEEWLREQKLSGIDMVGSSLGARIVLELARRGHTGHVIALDPGGFWQGWERNWAGSTLTASVMLLRTLGAAIRSLARNVVSRSALLAQLSAHPWALSGDFVASELESLARTSTVDQLIKDLTTGPEQDGSAPSGAITIGWGRHDRLCLPVQASRATLAFPGAHLAWFEHSGHFPMWDEPEAAAALILKATA